MSGPAGALFVAEPPQHYLVRPPLVLDCSTLAGLVFEEDWRREALQKIEGQSLNAPFLLSCNQKSQSSNNCRAGSNAQGRPIRTLSMRNMTAWMGR